MWRSVVGTAKDKQQGYHSNDTRGEGTRALLIHHLISKECRRIKSFPTDEVSISILLVIQIEDHVLFSTKVRR